VKLSNFLEYDSDTKNLQAWLPLLASAAREFLTSKGAQRSEILPLIKCGRRRYPTFVDHTATKSVFGLSDCKTFLNMLPSNASRIACLREVAKDFSDDQHFMVIQYVSDLIDTEYELASVAQLPGDSKKRSLDVDKPSRKFLGLVPDAGYQRTHSIGKLLPSLFQLTVSFHTFSSSMDTTGKMHPAVSTPNFL
jgi:hypothetical protein